jgi:hypothetical protein
MAPLLHHLASALVRRQQPPEDTSNQTSESRNLSGGAIAGIVIGSIAGILLLIWIFRSCGNGFGMGSTPPRNDAPAYYYHHERDRGHRRGRSRGSSRGGHYYEEDYPHGSRRHSHHSHHHHGRSPRRSGSTRPVVVEKVYATPQAVQQPVAAYYADPRASYGR